MDNYKEQIKEILLNYKKIEARLKTMVEDVKETPKDEEKKEENIIKTKKTEEVTEERPDEEKKPIIKEQEELPEEDEFKEQDEVSDMAKVVEILEKLSMSIDEIKEKLFKLENSDEEVLEEQEEEKPAEEKEEEKTLEEQEEEPKQKEKEIPEEPMVEKAKTMPDFNSIDGAFKESIRKEELEAIREVF